MRKRSTPRPRVSPRGLAYRPLFEPFEERPMHVVFFASGGPGNLQAAFDAEDAAPERIRIGAVVTDRFGIPAIPLAGARRRPCLVQDFSAECGTWAEHRGDPAREAAYRARAERFHDGVLARLRALEEELGWEFDLAVLAYRRIITGRLLDAFEERMINQHPADLSVLDAATGHRRYVGIGGLALALRSGEPTTRTSTILVRSSVDGGEVLAQGPRVAFSGDALDPQAVDAHENLQKRQSDWPCLRFTLTAIARGHYGLAVDERHPDGGKVLTLHGEPLPYGGVSLSGLEQPGLHP